MFPRFLSRPLALLSLTAALAAGSCTRRNAPDGPETWILAPEDSHYGMTYAEWSARWWQWVLEVPYPDNPLYDATGEKALNAQVDPVWFLCGIFGRSDQPTDGQAERTITVPAGKALFFPIINAEADPSMCLGTPDLTASVTEMRGWVLDAVDNVADVYCELDGVSLIDSPNLAGAVRYRATAPEFTISVPEDNVLSALWCTPETAIPPRIITPCVSDGIWLMLGPMPAGGHLLKFGGTFPTAGPFHLDIVYHITVLP